MLRAKVAYFYPDHAVRPPQTRTHLPPSERFAGTCVCLSGRLRDGGGRKLVKCEPSARLQGCPLVVSGAGLSRRVAAAAASATMRLVPPSGPYLAR